jgi:hypothetical protein
MEQQHWAHAGTATVTVASASRVTAVLTHLARGGIWRGLALLRTAQRYRWRLNWLGDYGNNTGSTVPGFTGWQQNPHSPFSLFAFVNTRSSGFADKQRYPGRSPGPGRGAPAAADKEQEQEQEQECGAGVAYLPSLLGRRAHERAMGAHIVYLPSRSGFRVVLWHDSPVTARQAEARGWAVSWIGLPLCGATAGRGGSSSGGGGDGGGGVGMSRSDSAVIGGVGLGSIRAGLSGDRWSLASGGGTADGTADGTVAVRNATLPSGGRAAVLDGLLAAVDAEPAGRAVQRHHPVTYVAALQVETLRGGLVEKLTGAGAIYPPRVAYADAAAVLDGLPSAAADSGNGTSGFSTHLFHATDVGLARRGGWRVVFAGYVHELYAVSTGAAPASSSSEDAGRSDSSAGAAGAGGAEGGEGGGPEGAARGGGRAGGAGQGAVGGGAVQVPPRVPVHRLTCGLSEWSEWTACTCGFMLAAVAGASISLPGAGAADSADSGSLLADRAVSSAVAAPGSRPFSMGYRRVRSRLPLAGSGATAASCVSPPIWVSTVAAPRGGAGGRAPRVRLFLQQMRQERKCAAPVGGGGGGADGGGGPCLAVGCARVRVDADGAPAAAAAYAGVYRMQVGQSSVAVLVACACA